MATQIKNIVRFVNVAPGATVVLPHELAISPPGGGELPQVPDHVTPDAAGFVITADAINVTVTNTNPTPVTVNVLVEVWHSIERAFGDVAVEDLVPKPFIEDSGGAGGGGSAINVEDEGIYVATQPTLNFTGTGVTAVDDPGNNRVNIDIPGGPVNCEDCLTDDPPTQIDVGDAAVVGVELSAARSDHQHEFPAPPAPVTVTGPTNATGAATTGARSDHEHRLGLIVDDEGVPVTVAGVGVPELNFLGAGVTAALVGDRVDVTIPAVAGPPGPPGPAGAGAIVAFGNQGIGAAEAGPGPDAPAPRWLDPWFGQLAPAGATMIEVPMPRAGTLRNMFVRHTDTGGAGAVPVTYSVWVNGVITLLAVTLATGVAGAQASNLVDSVVVAQGDSVAVRLQKATGGGGILNVNVTMELA
jgi:hypothetical protein